METLLIAFGSLIVGVLLASLLLYPFLKARFDAHVSESVWQRFDEWRQRELDIEARRQAEPLLEAWMAKSKEQIVQEALRRSSATIKGQIGERFAPLVPGFKYEPADARFLGNPVDYIVFDGLTEGQIKEIAFVEVKTGAAALTSYQRQVHEAIKAGRVTWRLVQMPEMRVDRELGPEGA